MKNLENNIKKWREELALSGGISREELDELESHLYDEIDALLEKGLSKEEAFDIAVKRVGSPEDVSEEYRKKRLCMSKSMFRKFLIPLLLIIMGIAVLFITPLSTVCKWLPKDRTFFNYGNNTFEDFISVQNLEQLTQANPTDDELLFGAGMLYYLMKHSIEAQKCFRKAYELDKNRAMYARYIASTYEGNEFPVNGLKQFSKEREDSLKKYMKIAQSLAPDNAFNYTSFAIPYEMDTLIQRLDSTSRYERDNSEYEKYMQKGIIDGTIPFKIALTENYHLLGRYLSPEKRENFKKLISCSRYSNYSLHANQLIFMTLKALDRDNYYTRTSLSLSFVNGWLSDGVFISFLNSQNLYFHNLGPFENSDVIKQTETELLDCLRISQHFVYLTHNTSKFANEIVNSAYDNLIYFYELNNMPQKAELASNALFCSKTLGSEYELHKRNVIYQNKNSHVIMFFIHSLALPMLILLILSILSTIIISIFKLYYFEINPYIIFRNYVLLIVLIVIGVLLYSVTIGNLTGSSNLISSIAYSLISIILGVFILMRNNARYNPSVVLRVVALFLILLNPILLLIDINILVFIALLFLMVQTIIATSIAQETGNRRLFWVVCGKTSAYIFFVLILVLGCLSYKPLDKYEKIMSESANTIESFFFSKVKPGLIMPNTLDNMPFYKTDHNNYSKATFENITKIDSLFIKQNKPPINWQKRGIIFNNGDNNGHN